MITKTIIHHETYKLKLAASPHIAARDEAVKIDLNKIEEDYFKIVNGQLSMVSEKPSIHHSPLTTHTLIIEGAGGLIGSFK